MIFNMRKIFLYLFLLSALLSCQDEVDVDNLLSFAPTVMSVTPKNGVKTGDFDVKVIFVDGSNSPLSSATVTIEDADGNEVTSATKTLTGVKDSVVIEGATFNASSLPLGDYKMIIKASDTRGNEVNQTLPFKIVNQLYLANQAAMYIAGAFNGWGAGELELVANNTWEIKNIDLTGGPWKLKNTVDWSDVDWGDSNCDGTMEITTGGGPNTECGYAGLVNVRFNDETLKYSVVPAVNFATNLSGLYLLGTFNDFTGPVPKFTLTADNTWVLEEFRLAEGDVLRFSEGPYFNGKTYGDANMDGKAAEGDPNITLADGFEDAFYKITFNDATLRYSFELVRYPFPANLYLVGGATTAGWNPGASIPFLKTGDGKFEIYAFLTDADGFKFLQVKDWAGDWGKGATDGSVVQEGESNLEVTADGVYRITVDFTNNTYTVTKTDWGVIGSATPGQWSTDTNMTFTGGYTWEADITLTAGELKFRANDDWGINFGAGGTAGVLQFNSPNNIAGPGAGNYHIEMTLDPVNGYTYSITPQ